MRSTIYSLLLFFSITLLGQIPAIMVKKAPDKPSTPLGIQSAKIDIAVAGNRATTTMELTFRNKLDRVLEGQFYFPLVEGAVVSRFALEVNKKLREGVVVEKSKGQKVFESVVRQQIDPGLLQWTKGNNFKARIYPIPAKGTKKLLIAYEQELIKTPAGYRYHLPLSFKNRMDLFSVKISAHHQEIKPVVARKKDLINFRFQKKGDLYSAELVQERYTPNRSVQFTLPTPEQKPVVLTGNWKRTDHFYLNIAPKISKQEKKLPRNLCIVWDGSNSAADKDLKRELALINSYIKKLNNPMIFLWVLRNDLERLGRLSPEKFNETIKTLPYDGGTQLGALDLKLKQFSICEEIIFSTDGISNFGKPMPNFEEIPIITLNSKTTAEHSVLSYIARKSGGIYINLDRLTNKAAAKLLMVQPFQFIKATYNPSEISELYPSLPTPVTDRFSLGGKLNKDEAEITLHFGFGTDVKTTEKIVIKKSDTPGMMIPRIWAKLKISELEQQPEKNQHAIVKTGKKYSIVTRYTSLLVLDRLEDYVKHNIVPPKELQEQYFKIVENRKQKRKETLKTHMDNLHSRYQGMVTYWNRTFKWDRPVYKAKMKKSLHSFSTRNGAVRLEAARVASPERERLADQRPRRPQRAKKKASGGKRGATGGIQLAKWRPDTPYLKALDKATEKHYALYLTLKKDYTNSSAFFLDVADFFVEKKQPKIALRILSNIAEMELENHQLLRILAHRLAQLKKYDLAISIFEQVAKIRPEEPQSFRDLGLTHSLNNQPQKAIDYLYRVIANKWDSRFSDIDLIALHEINAIIALNKGLDTSKIEKRLIKNLHTDIRVVLNWDADNTDMDLWVTDPNGEKCYYSHKKTYIGGWMSRDFTGGYGPEAFWLKRAKPGEYKIEVNYYGSRQQTLAGATTIQIQLFLNYGRTNQKLKEITMRLKGKKEVVKAGTFTIEAGKDGMSATPAQPGIFELLFNRR